MTKRNLKVERVEGQSDEDALAASTLSPSVNAALVVSELAGKKYGEALPLNALVDALEQQLKLVHEGEMGRAEGMLIAQAHTLDALFSRLADKAVVDIMQERYLTPYLKLALKAQSQCQSTLRTLGELKNPKQMAFIKQANMAQGHQQVNNGPRAGIENKQNELLEATNERLDTRAQGAPQAGDTGVETMGAVHRPKD